MKNEDEKKGFWERLTGKKKGKKSPCCCDFQIEELPDDDGKNKDYNDKANSKK